MYCRGNCGSSSDSNTFTIFFLSRRWTVIRKMSWKRRNGWNYVIAINYSWYVQYVYLMYIHILKFNKSCEVASFDRWELSNFQFHFPGNEKLRNFDVVKFLSANYGNLRNPLSPLVQNRFKAFMYKITFWLMISESIGQELLFIAKGMNRKDAIFPPLKWKCPKGI